MVLFVEVQISLGLFFFFSMMACFLWSLGGCALVWIRAGFSLAARLFKSVEVGPFGRCSRRVSPWL